MPHSRPTPLHPEFITICRRSAFRAREIGVDVGIISDAPGDDGRFQSGGEGGVGGRGGGARGGDGEGGTGEGGGGVRGGMAEAACDSILKNASGAVFATFFFPPARALCFVSRSDVCMVVVCGRCIYCSTRALDILQHK
jgi:hypothetical protein